MATETLTESIARAAAVLDEWGKRTAALLPRVPGTVTLLATPIGQVRIVSDIHAPPGGFEISPTEWVLTPEDFKRLAIWLDRDRLIARVWD